MKKVLMLICMLSTGSLCWAATAPSLGTASAFAVLSAAPGGGGAVSCTNSSITGAVGSSGLPAAVVRTVCPIAGAIIAPVSAQVLTDFNAAYDALASPLTTPCDHVLSTLDVDQTLSPGVYCFDAAATSTNHVLTLNGTPTDIWIFKIGTLGTGALTGTGFSVVMANGANGGLPCNVFWWVAEAATMSNSNFAGTILAGAAISSTGGSTGGTFVGRALAKAAVTLTTGTTLTDTCLGQNQGGGGDNDDHRGCKNDDDDRDKDHHDRDKDHHEGDKDHRDDDHKD